MTDNETEGKVSQEKDKKEAEKIKDFYSTFFSADTAVLLARGAALTAVFSVVSAATNFLLTRYTRLRPKAKLYSVKGTGLRR